MGMGLAFCHKMLKKMDSKLELSSIKNIGSTFTFKLIADFQSDIEKPRNTKEYLKDKMNMDQTVPKAINRNNGRKKKNTTNFKVSKFNPVSKTKRSVSVFNNEKIGNLGLLPVRMTLKPIEEANEPP